MSSELSELFERTMPADDVILHRMAASRARRMERSNGMTFSRPGVWALASLGVCAAGVALIGVVRDPAPRAEPERFDTPISVAPIVTVPAEKPVGEITVPARGVEPRASETTVKSEPAPLQAKEGLVGGITPSATWEAAAQALRAGDRAEAERLLEELTKSDDPEVRDGARLVRLRSLVYSASTEARSWSPAERAELLSLAESGATASIRASARKLLEQTSATLDR